MATLDWERACWRDQYRWVVGIDEAGRGALAGPIVAGAVVLPLFTRLTAQYREINDSKLLAEQTRDRLADSSSLWPFHGRWLGHRGEIDEIGSPRQSICAWSGRLES